MEMSPVFFYIFAALGIVSSLLVILKSNPVASAFCLVLSFFSFAAIYALMGAHLVAAIQILVYAGAVMVLFVFVIMLLNASAPELELSRIPTWMKALVTGLSILLLGCFIWSFRETVLPIGVGVHSDSVVEEAGGNTQVISELMFSEYILPFELTSVLLLTAIVGTVAIAMRKDKGAGGH